MSSIEQVIGREVLDSRGNPTVEVEVVLEDPAYSVSLRHAVEQMGDQVEEREGRYFVATRRPGPTRTALAQLPYVQSVI